MKEHKKPSTGGGSPSVSDRISAWEKTSTESNSSHLSNVRLEGGGSSTPVLDSASKDGKGGRKGGGGNASGGYDAKSGQWTGDRPSKPKQLTGKDEENHDLTAHHLYPWNAIRSDLNKALANKDKDAMQRLLDFGQTTVDESFWTDFALDPGQRSPEFASTLIDKVRDICWSPSNVFMGPEGKKRSRDPGEERDTTYAWSGVPTPSSALAEMMEKQGGIGEKPSLLVERFMKNTLEATDRTTRRYEPREWDTEEYTTKKGKKVGLKHRGKIPLNKDDDTTFDPNRKVNNVTEKVMTPEERKQIAREEGLRRQKELQEKDKKSTSDDTDDQGFSSLFGEDEESTIAEDDADLGVVSLFGEDE